MSTWICYVVKSFLIKLNSRDFMELYNIDMLYDFANFLSIWLFVKLIFNTLQFVECVRFKIGYLHTCLGHRSLMALVICTWFLWSPFLHKNFEIQRCPHCVKVACQTTSRKLSNSPCILNLYRNCVYIHTHGRRNLHITIHRY